MMLAIAQYNGTEKVFEMLYVEKDLYTRLSTFPTHYYKENISPRLFFELERKYHLSFKLEFII